MNNFLGRKIYNSLIFSILIVAFSFFIVRPGYGADEEGDNKTAFIMHHIQDAHEWHFATIGHTHISIPLPVIIFESGHGLRFYMSSDFVDEHHEGIEKDGYHIDEHGHLKSTDESLGFYDISITKNVASLFISVILLFLVFLTMGKRYTQNPLGTPKGIQSVFEPIIIFIRDEIARPNIGEGKYEKFMPYLLSVFFFIWFNNLLGLLPGAANLTGNISVTMTLALFTFVVTTFAGTKDYWKHIFNTPGVPWWLKFPVPLIMNMVELLVAFIQAFVFTLLSAIYFGLAVEEHHHEEHKEKLENVPA